MATKRATRQEQQSGEGSNYGPASIAVANKRESLAHRQQASSHWCTRVFPIRACQVKPVTCR